MNHIEHQLDQFGWFWEYLPDDIRIGFTKYVGPHHPGEYTEWFYAYYIFKGDHLNDVVKSNPRIKTLKRCVEEARAEAKKIQDRA